MDLKNTGLVLTLWDIGFGLEKYWDSLLDSKWFYMLELALKNTWTTLLGLDWLYLVYDILDMDLRNNQR